MQPIFKNFSQKSQNAPASAAPQGLRGARRTGRPAANAPMRRLFVPAHCHERGAGGIQIRHEKISAPCLLAAACAPYDYSARVSEVRSDLFLAETEAFTLTVACVSREYPYADDGIPCPMTDTLEASLAPKGDAPAAVEIYADGTGWGGEASFSAVYGEYRFSEGVSAFPEGTLSLRVVWGEKEVSLAATSVRTEQTLTPEEALAAFTAAEKETLKRMQKEGAFCGELCIRLLLREKNY